MKEKIIGILLCICLCVAILPDIAIAKENRNNGIGQLENTTYVTDNVSLQDYSTRSSCIRSYLVPENTGYLRIYAMSDGKVLTEHYDYSFTYLSQKYIEAELPIFGGFYAGKENYYLVWGQENEMESDAAEVVRVVKYDKLWNRIGSASVYGANTKVPFKSGSLRMAEYDGYLYIHTCHQMYRSSDGLNHQANMTYQIREHDMAVADSAYNVSLDYVYVSHSFNQFIIVDDAQNLVTLDQGDAYPRAALLGKYGKSAGTDGFRVNWSVNEDTVQFGFSSVGVFKYEGNTGDNNTGASVGGLDYSDTKYLTVGNSVYPKENPIDSYLLRAVRNVYITTTDRNDFTQNGTELKWITNYTENDKISASTPQLVKLGEDSFLLLWAHMNYEAGGVWMSNPTGKISYVFLDGDGNTVSPVYTEDGYLSDCRPVVSGNDVVWYVADDEKLTFYTIDKNGALTDSQVVFPTSIMVYPKSIADCRIIFTKIGTISRDGYADYLAVVDAGKVLSKDKDYYFGSVLAAVKDGVVYYANPTAVGMGDYTKSLDWQTYPISQFPTLNSVTRVSSGVRLEWEKEYGIGYLIFRKADDGEYINIKKIEDYQTTSWLDMDVDSDKQYSYYIEAYTTDGVQEYYSSESNIGIIPAMSNGNTDSPDTSDKEDIVKPTPDISAIPEPSVVPTKTPDATARPSVTSKPADEEKVDTNDSTKKLKKGSKVTDRETKAVYRVTSMGNSKTVEYINSTKKNAASITIPASVELEGKTYKVTSVGKAAFKNSKKLETVKIGKNIRSIGSNAFSGCTKLADVALGKNVTVIGTDAFNKCTALTLIVIPAKVKKIATKAFYQCKNLRYIQVKTKKLSADKVGNNAFGGGYISPRVKTDKSVWKRYSHIFLSRGMSKKAVFIVDPVKLVIGSFNF